LQRTVKCACLLKSAGYEDWGISKVEIFTHQAASQGADIIVFPEMFMGLPTPDRPPIKIVEDNENTFIERLKTLSSEMDISITAGW
jgi:predicted amidohydrolase